MIYEVYIDDRKRSKLNHPDGYDIELSNWIKEDGYNFIKKENPKNWLTKLFYSNKLYLETKDYTRDKKLNKLLGSKV